MPAMIVLYGTPVDVAEFERYYAEEHLPFAAEQMPHVTGAQNLRVAETARGSDDCYRFSMMTFDSTEEMRAAVGSEGGQAVLADLDNFATGGATVLLSDD